MTDLRKQLIRLAHENPGEVRDALLPILKEAKGDKARLAKWMKHVEVPENDLIEMAQRAERGELGPKSKEILKYLDEAIDKLSLARNAMYHARARIR